MMRLKTRLQPNFKQLVYPELNSEQTMFNFTLLYSKIRILLHRLDACMHTYNNDCVGTILKLF